MYSESATDNAEKQQVQGPVQEKTGRHKTATMLSYNLYNFHTTFPAISARQCYQGTGIYCQNVNWNDFRARLTLEYIWRLVMQLGSTLVSIQSYMPWWTLDFEKVLFIQFWALEILLFTVDVYFLLRILSFFWLSQKSGSITWRLKQLKGIFNALPRTRTVCLYDSLSVIWCFFLESS